MSTKTTLTLLVLLNLGILAIIASPALKLFGYKVVFSAMSMAFLLAIPFSLVFWFVGKRAMKKD